jgi:superfamily I DNA/RNA helicase
MNVATSDVLASFALDSNRRELATRTDRNVLVLAGPGAGKTHLLVAHAVWLAEQDTGRVILLTYSRKAAAEMKRRADEALSVEARRLVLANTIHAYALDLLRNYGHRVGIARGELEPIEGKDLQALADEVARRDGMTPMDDFVTRFERYQRIRGDMSATTLPPIVGAVDRELRARGRLDWDSCIRIATELLSSNADVRESVRHHDRNILLDEAQDCDANQLGLVEQIIGEPPGIGHLFVVMDPDQSLYAFRQANPELVRSWARGYAADDTEITENFRCSPRIQALAKHVLAKTWSGRLDPGVARMSSFANRDAEASWLSSEIEGKLANGVEPRRLAVLARRRSRLLEIERELSARFAIRTDPREQWTAPEERILAAVAFIKDWRDGAADPAVVTTFLIDVVGLSSADVLALEQDSVRSSRHPGDLLGVEWWRLLVAWLEERRSPVQIIEELAPLARAEDGDLRALRVLAQQARNLGDLLRSARSGPDPAHSTGVAGVLVTTFHGAKGLEFDTVFIVGCEDGTIPDFRARDEKALRDERRALYVAITRAASEVVMTYLTSDRGYAKQPSRFLPPATDQLWTS